MDCIFCEIVKKNIPAKIIHETEHTLAFLDVNPVVPGHVLVVPKKHCLDITDCDPLILKEIMLECQKIAQALKLKLNASGVNVLNASGASAQQSVFHLHFHVVPRYDNDNLNLWFHGRKDHETNFDEIYQKLKF